MPSQRTQWNEATRVQMPALVHLTRIGYIYFGKLSEDMAGSVYDPDTNILIDVFKTQFEKLNPEKSGEALTTLRQIRQELDNDDLGESFYKRLKAVSPVKLVDFEHPENNTYHCTAEFTCKRDEDEFRPDITLFINGLPLVFIEVKKPNNPGGMVAEADRMNKQRFPNKKFRRFINITQLMIFSNNMEYDALGGIVPIQGAFYCTASKKKAPFNCFRENNPLNQDIAPYINEYPYIPINVEAEKRILSDFNNQVIHTTSEYQTNLNVNTPTNRIITSMCSPERLLFLLKYGITYYHKTKERPDGSIEQIDQKHIMRYQQFFAALEVRKRIAEGITSGIIWHTQGSGKTALSYHLSYVLTDYFSSVNKVAKYYFVVDRLDLMKQAKEEFEARGLIVKTANSRAELMEQFKTNQSQEGTTGEPEITVVNIQRFEENQDKVILPAYATNLQRVFIIDEAHRGYKPEGSFLANLFDADPNSIKIALTGTPIENTLTELWSLFDYLMPGYLLSQAKFKQRYETPIVKEQDEQAATDLRRHIMPFILRRTKKEDIIEHPNYVKELLRYIITDLKQFRVLRGDDTLGGMVICETSEQARRLFAYFDEIQNELNTGASNQSHFKAGLILYDSDDKETREGVITDFKDNFKVDILIVFNMLLTGFDAPRLKRLYFGRKLKDHNLLQAITRVNRPYGDNRYGYVIDFADIKKNFDETNAAYLAELNRFNDPNEVGAGNEVDIFTQVMEDPAELIQRMQQARQTLFNYPLDNAEEFSTEISTIEDKELLLELKKALIEVRDCCNIVKTFGDEDLKAAFANFEVTRIKDILSEVQRHINIINQREAITGGDTTRVMVNEAMQDITFNFSKIGEEELKLVSGGMELNEKLQKTIRKFTENVDPEDPEYITLREAFHKRFQEHGFTPQNMDEFNAYSRSMDEILEKLAELQRKNNALLKRYNGDAKFARVHKRIREENTRRKIVGKTIILSEYDENIVNVLMTIKGTIDQKVYDRNDILKKDAYFERTVMTEITAGMNALGISTARDDRTFIQSRIAKQYMAQYNDTYPAA